MLFVADIGNSSTVTGVFDGANLVDRWELTTIERTADEYRLLLAGVLATYRGRLTGAAISSVVPRMAGVIRAAVDGIVTGPVVLVGPGTKTGMPIRIDNPREVGADRIANALGAVEGFGAPIIAVDFGTATTLDVVDSSGAYIGGIIAPGVRISADALVRATSALRRVEVEVPRHVVGRSTVEAIQSGLVHGFAGLVDGLVRKVMEEAGFAEVPVVATGGLSSVLAPVSATITHVDPDLTLRGLRIVFDRNSI
ncbi:MAG: type III pantothenate kinase [Acidimicrobiia bacterium]|nr:type III pantothenate kinase [Acidimicrobiia bacterium]